MKLRGLLAVPLLLGGAAVDVHAQACAPEAPLRRTLPVNVLDERMQPVLGLTAANFRAEFRGQPVKILSATLDTQPRRIVLLLDTSGSMAARVGKWELAVAAAEDILGWGPADSSVALVTFGEEVEQRVGLSQEAREAREILKSARPADSKSDPSGTRTAALDALLEAAALLKPVREGDIIYVVSDGLDTKSRATRDAVEQALIQSGARVFAFLLGESGPLQVSIQGVGILPSPGLLPMIFGASTGTEPPELIDVGGGGAVRKLVTATGGMGFTVFAAGRSAPRYDLSEKDRAGVAAAARVMYPAMAEFYRLEVELAEESDKVREWKLEVVDARDKKMKKAGVIYPRKLGPCGSEP